MSSLTDLRKRILLDRYAQKSSSLNDLAKGDQVVALINGGREPAEVLSLDGKTTKIKLIPSGEEMDVGALMMDRLLETTEAEIQARVARGIASVETHESKKRYYEKQFSWLLKDWKFVPAGRILTSAGTDQALTSYNCYVIPNIPDSRGGIFKSLETMAEIMSRGGGVGMNISSLRPKNAYGKGVNGRSSGAVSCAGIFIVVTGLIEQAGSRRGASMSTMNDWHPDIFDFINS
jgi:ribonucleoside-diphosphate reductase alpha chain